MKPTASGALFGGLVRLIFALGLALAAVAATAQSDDSDFLANYYLDPRPERLPDYLAGLDSEDWRSYPPVAGFMAAVFKDDPDTIELLLPEEPSPKLAAALAAALHLSGHASRVKQLTGEDGQLLNEKLLEEFANLPDELDDLTISSATHLDILWGAAFASGDPRYPRKILDFMAEVANQSEPIAADIAGVVLAMMGGPKEPMETLRSKYDQDDGYRIVVAAAALWGLQANAKRHSFVEAVVRGYLSEAPDSFASKAISVFFEES